MPARKPPRRAESQGLGDQQQQHVRLSAALPSRTKAAREPKPSGLCDELPACPVPFISCAKNNEVSDCLTCLFFGQRPAFFGQPFMWICALGQKGRARMGSCLSAPKICSLKPLPLEAQFHSDRARPGRSEQSVLSFVASRSFFLSGQLLLGNLSKTVVVVGNTPHDCPGFLVGHLIGNRATFLCTKAQMLRVQETNFLHGIRSYWARCSGDLPLSPPAEKATASKDQAGKSCAHEIPRAGPRLVFEEAAPSGSGLTSCSPVCTTTNVSRRRRRALGFPPRQRSWAAREG